MTNLKLNVLSLRYSSWSMRAWLALTHAGAAFDIETVELRHMLRQGDKDGESRVLAKINPRTLPERRTLGSVHGLFPVLRVDGQPIHESLAICEYAAEAFPDAQLWPTDMMLRAQARSLCCEMVSGFASMRDELSSHMFGRVAGFSPNEGTLADIARVFEIWENCLASSGGPFLFGAFTIADAVYYPVLTRFRTYKIDIPGSLTDYAKAMDTTPCVEKLVNLARSEPRIPIYDNYLLNLGGDPDGGLSE